jgi:hypothetical protein
LLATLPLVAGLSAGCQDSTSPSDESTPTSAGDDDTPTPTPSPTSNLSTDPELARNPLSHHSSRARVIREFLPDAGPASIAVAFPTEATDTNQAYCFDAGACRFRYAWQGGFIRIPYTKDDTGSLQGNRYYTATQDFPLRFDTGGGQPSTSFEGYTLVEGLPEFQYQVDETAVRQRLRPAESGLGLTHEFTIPNPGGGVTYIADRSSGVTVEASAGTWSGDRLQLARNEAREFTVSITGESA